MKITHKLAEMLASPCPPPPGWLNDLPEAFGALDEHGEVVVIGYKGEWYAPIKPSLRVRLHNWLIQVGDRRKHAAVDELCDALRLTAEYVGTETLPAAQGWTWYDALRKYRPDMAKRLAPRYNEEPQ